MVAVWSDGSARCFKGATFVRVGDGPARGGPSTGRVLVVALPVRVVAWGGVCAFPWRVTL